MMHLCPDGDRCGDREAIRAVGAAVVRGVRGEDGEQRLYQSWYHIVRVLHVGRVLVGARDG